MTNWLERNKSALIRSAFLVPIISVATISISHVIGWYDLANPPTWAIYLSIAVEIAAMSAIAAASIRIKGFSVWFVFGVVTLIQFIGNIYFSYAQIDINSKAFKDWTDLIAPITDAMGNTATDLIAQRRFLAILEGGLLPLISLTCLHFFISYGESEKKETQNEISAQSIETKELERLEIEQESEITVNSEQKPQIDNIEESDDAIQTDELEQSLPQTDYLIKLEDTPRDNVVKVEQLSHKMKKILRK